MEMEPALTCLEQTPIAGPQEGRIQGLARRAQSFAAS